MFDFHSDKSVYFNYQYYTSKEYIIPFLESTFELSPSLKVLEIGCAEAGVLKAFTERGHTCVGIELLQHRVKLAEKFLSEELEEGKIRFLAKNIYDLDIQEEIGHTFDLVILKDVIEHIHDQEKFFRALRQFLSPGGKIFFGFPPWQMPFGGHQQKCKSKLLSVLPYYHLLPMPLYKGMLKLFGETELKVSNLAEIKETGISIERFERIYNSQNYKLLKRQLFLINPIYKYKFKLTPRAQFKLIERIPWVRNFLSTCAYYVLEG